MQYNIHPLIVHFPIALLFLYSTIKILPFKRFFPSVSWKDVEKILLFFGVLAAFVARATGELAEELTRPNHLLVEKHELFSGITVFIYGALLLGVLASYLKTLRYMPFNGLWAFIERSLSLSFFSKILAFMGLIALTITGMLGGVMVYGLTADPLAPMVLKVLGISI